MKTAIEESPEIEQLKLELEKLLQNHPELIPLQQEIDKIKAANLDPAERLNAIFLYLGERLNKLSAANTDLKNECAKFIINLKTQS